MKHGWGTEIGVRRIRIRLSANKGSMGVVMAVRHVAVGLVGGWGRRLVGMLAVIVIHRGPLRKDRNRQSRVK